MMSNYQRPYQGYPYVNPLVIDVPSISAVDAARWINLPRRQVEVNVRKETQVSLPERSESSVPVKRDSDPDSVVYVDLPEAFDNDTVDGNIDGHDFELQERPQDSIPEKRNSHSSPVVYIDMPEASSSHVADRVAEGHDFEVIEPQASNTVPKRDPDAPVLYIDVPEPDGSVTQSRDQTSAEEPEFVQLQERPQDSIPEKRNSHSSPVVYIDMPEASGSHVADRVAEGHDFEVIEPQASNTVPKRDPEAPVLYIDVPEPDGSVTQSRDQTSAEEPEFVQETIFYDPFENRRIDSPKPEDPGEPDSEEGRPQRPARRPNALDLSGTTRPASSARASATIPNPSGMSTMSKEAEIYGRTDSNGFPASPIPVSHFPEPPPAYTEIDVSSPVEVPVVDQPRPEEPPRTQVIVHREQIATPTTPVGVPHPDRKFLNCHHCGMRVHTLVIRENGTITHATAAACCILCLLPGCVWAYCTKYFKVKNHYCPNCNKIIAYQLPMANKIFHVE